MYLPRHFEERGLDALTALMRAHPLGWLVSAHGGELQADPIPFLYEPRPEGQLGTLLGHVARQNPVAARGPGSSEVLVLFQGPQAYVSPSAYPSKAEHGKVVPTWNYMVVQARGRLQLLDDPEATREIVQRLTTAQEVSQQTPWRLDDAPDAYIAAQLKAIVGVRIELSDLVGKWKLSQNRTPADADGVIARFRSSERADEQALATAMADVHPKRAGSGA